MVGFQTPFKWRYSFRNTTEYFYKTKYVAWTNILASITWFCLFDWNLNLKQASWSYVWHNFPLKLLPIKHQPTFSKLVLLVKRTRWKQMTFNFMQRSTKKYKNIKTGICIHLLWPWDWQPKDSASISAFTSPPNKSDYLSPFNFFLKVNWVSVWPVVLEISFKCPQTRKMVQNGLGCRTVGGGFSVQHKKQQQMSHTPGLTRQLELKTKGMISKA